MTGGGYLNGSGYPDPTAYKAIQRMEDKSMSMDVNRGEIWKYMAGENERDGIVVGYDNVTVAVYPLLDIDLGGCIEIVTREGIKYIHPLRMAYTTRKKLVDYLQDVPEDTMHEIKTAISAGLGLTLAEPSRTATVLDDGARDEAERLKAENQRLQSELIESTVRAKVMTEQYDTLLERFCSSMR